MAQTIPFKETLQSKDELFEDFKKFAERKKELGQNALLAYYGLLHGAAITQYCDKQNKQQDLLRHAGIPVTSLAYFQAGINAWINLYNGRTILPELNETAGLLLSDSDDPLQQIFYGAPGTGKSYEVNEKTKGYSVIRTTFHPDTDYASFVGTYKPTMENGKITYQFVKQAFLKAYLAAWKKYADNNINSSSSSSLTIQTSNGRYTITGANNHKVSYERTVTYRISNGNLVTTWNEIWKNGSFVMPKGGSGRSLEQAISKWIYDTISPCKKEDFKKGLGEFIQKINETKEVEASKNTQNGQKYVFSPSDDDSVFIVKTISHSSKNIVRHAFENEEDYENADEKIKKLVDKLREFDDDFETAWDRLAEAVKQNETVDTPKDAVPEPDRQFLIIEEINRGNCAQIFGDLFQLLDRSDNGFSTYPIEADADMQKAIADAFKSEPEFQLGGDINVEGMVSNYGPTLSNDIQEGRILVLPPNLYIWATMNTSDQSLFPMDSAFKRRWEWKCVPIDYDNLVSGKFNITIDDVSYCWHDFLKAVNDRIKTTTQSEDKQMGNFFIKQSIDERQFINKVMFYLWNDICKDEYLTKNNFFRTYSSKTETEEFTFNDLFGPKAKELLTKFMKYLQVEPIKTIIEVPTTIEEIVTETEAQ